MSNLNKLNAFFNTLDEQHKANEQNYLCVVEEVYKKHPLGTQGPHVVIDGSSLRFSDSFGKLIKYYFKYETLEELNEIFAGCELNIDTNLEVLSVKLISKNSAEAKNVNLLPLEIFNKSKQVRGVKLNNHVSTYLKKEIGDTALRIFNIDMHFDYGARVKTPYILYFKYYKNFDNILKVIN